MTITTAPAVEAFDRALGDPGEPDGVFSYARCNELDKAEAFPDEICALLNAQGLQRHYVPEEYGGALGEVPVVLELLRAVARRDLTMAIGHSKTFLGAVGAWVSPTDPASQEMARQVLEGAAISSGLTEQAHGSDLVSGQVRAEEVPGGFRLTGEKWAINNATRCRTIAVLARTGDGPRGFDVLMVDKTALAPESFRCLPKFRTHGIRGANISGIVFDNAFLPAEARLGRPRTGLETMLKGLQLSRTLCSALSLGPGEHALRLVLEGPGPGAPPSGSGGRTGGAERPEEARTLADAGADHLLNEAAAQVGCRGIHTFPQETGVVSAVLKYLLPTRADRMIADLGRLLGTRARLVDGDLDGRFQKLARDHRVVGLFDGNTLVNLNMLVNEFATLARHAEAPYDEEALRTAADPGRPLPPLNLAALRLTTRAGSSVLRALPDLAAAVAGTPAGPLAARLLGQYRRLVAELAEHRHPGLKVPRHVFAQADRLTLCWAGAAVLAVAAHAAPPEGDPLWADGLWQRAALGRVLAALGEPAERPAGQDQELVRALRDRLESGRSLTLMPHRVAEGVTR
ncbi:acyl-CoA dehydrogenase family protein [Streptomyces sp. DSM 44917]|uniref:Acyl-CoA dehydrogenase family protein n=1 Tax=Streptomyces boetiae TaxID=3075541 RepID=A0ABU2LBK5_9ACTN|nr:acyl-CoA dehydrogenase family protein [Streptomyces sp. DSM 44917]MDT0308861.1 acyl-CoA dehydrogenase family protein [Streptomyces sp. DSM 44917]